MLDRDDPNLSVRAQCAMLGLSRSGVYRQRAANDDDDLALMRRIDKLFLQHPFLGSRRMAQMLSTPQAPVNRKRVQRLMRLMGLVAIYQRPNTSKAAAEHIKYPYLLGGLTIDRVNQVWCSDITYIPMPRGFLYLVVIMDAVRFCPGACPTPCTPTSVSRRWRRRCEGSDGRRSSTPIKAASSPAMTLLAC
jgi:putative transposase